VVVVVVVVRVSPTNTTGGEAARSVAGPVTAVAICRSGVAGSTLVGKAPTVDATPTVISAEAEIVVTVVSPPLTVDAGGELDASTSGAADEVDEVDAVVVGSLTAIVVSGVVVDVGGGPTVINSAYSGAAPVTAMVSGAASCVVAGSDDALSGESTTARVRGSATGSTVAGSASAGAEAGAVCSPAIVGVAPHVF
jgi:hypothetical protein